MLPISINVYLHYSNEILLLHDVIKEKTQARTYEKF